MVSIVIFEVFNKDAVKQVSERTAIASLKFKQEKNNFINMTFFGILPERLNANIYHFTEIILQSEMIFEGSNRDEDFEYIYARL